MSDIRSEIISAHPQPLSAEDILAGIKDQRFGYVVHNGKLTVGTDRRVGIDLQELADFLSQAALSAQVKDDRRAITCQCENTITDPCIVCGKGKTLVTAEWLQKMAAREGDLDCTTGRPTAAPAQEQNATLLRMIDIAEDRLMAIHKALHPEMHGVGGIESPEDHVAYMTGVLQAAVAAAPTHADDIAVDRFAAAMKEKLAKKRLEGRSGWEDKDDCSQLFISQLLREHVEKGDPIDVGNFAMMLHQREERIASLLETLQGE
ncbi:hypothetical protein [Agrobacterium vitis]|uniref:hypothetical protein n=1 Tax=Agrobacterium vitis TaxID=373 RepID=UPI000A5CB898|nr:hypothetical protein [Agrobacterium vitis]